MVEYCVHRNGTQAAIAAGYSKKTAPVLAHRQLNNPLVQLAIAKIDKQDEYKLELTKEKVLGELANGLFRDPVGMQSEEGFVVTDLRKIPRELRTLIDKFEVFQYIGEDGRITSQKIKVTLTPKGQMLDMSMKHLGAYAAEKQVQKISLDLDGLYNRSTIVDPAEQAINQLTEE